MRKRIFGSYLSIVCFCVIPVLVLPSMGFSFSYSHDFSTDPGWTTNYPPWFYWNAGLETYHLTFISNGAHNYTYVDVDWSDQSFMFAYDIVINQDGYGSGIWFGVYSTSMANYHDNHVVSHLGRDDGGHNIFLHTCANNSPIYNGVNYPWPMHTWFRVEVFYDAPSNTASMIVMIKATGDTLMVLSNPLADSLVDLVKFGASSRYISVYHNTFQAEIDNVEFAWTTYMIEATVDIHPDVLNLKSGGRWVTCYIELPVEYSIDDIDLGTVALTAVDGASIDPPLYREGPTGIGDYDEDGIPDLKVKFDRQELISILDGMIAPPADAELTVSGELSDNVQFEGSDIVHVIRPGGGPQSAGTGNLPSRFALQAAKPNPFVSNTAITYALPKYGRVELNVYDASGSLAKTLLDENVDPGYHDVLWDGRDERGHRLPNGVYFLRLEAGEYEEVRKLLLIR